MFPINPGNTDILLGEIGTLHSTMFPINPEENVTDYDIVDLYIPLCFLLI